MHAYVSHDGRARLCGQGRVCLPLPSTTITQSVGNIWAHNCCAYIGLSAFNCVITDLLKCTAAVTPGFGAMVQQIVYEIGAKTGPKEVHT